MVSLQVVKFPPTNHSTHVIDASARSNRHENKKILLSDFTGFSQKFAPPKINMACETVSSAPTTVVQQAGGEERGSHGGSRRCQR